MPVTRAPGRELIRATEIVVENLDLDNLPSDPEQLRIIVAAQRDLITLRQQEIKLERERTDAKEVHNRQLRARLQSEASEEYLKNLGLPPLARTVIVSGAGLGIFSSGIFVSAFLPTGIGMAIWLLGVSIIALAWVVWILESVNRTDRRNQSAKVGGQSHEQY